MVAAGGFFKHLNHNSAAGVFHLPVTHITFLFLVLPRAIKEHHLTQDTLMSADNNSMGKMFSIFKMFQEHLLV